MKKILLDRIQTLAHPLSVVPTGHPVQLKKLPSIRCVAFDFYGTMFLSGVGDIGIAEEREPKNESAFRGALADTGFTVTRNATGMLGIGLFQKVFAHYSDQKKAAGIDYPEPNIVDVWVEVLESLSEKQLIKGKTLRAQAMRFAIEYEFRVNDVWPVPNLARVLTGLMEHNVLLGIISNSQFYTPLTFEAIIGKPPEIFGFDANLLNWSYKAGIKKPSAGFYTLFTDSLKKHHNLSPEEVLFVGNDLGKDIRPAGKLGIKTALYTGDIRSVRHTNEDLKQTKYQPDLIIDDLDQIMECVV